MEKKNAIAYFVYRLSYERNLPVGTPIYRFGSKENFEKPIGYIKNYLFDDRVMIPREFETEKEAELVKAELEKQGLFDNWKIERILDHIEILDDEKSAE
ncbi:MAG: hypothetical protein J6Y20_05480 [Lachnospiraceae bacterium]|nr:hypothetical protein [Lachnospiraceae bacterium]